MRINQNITAFNAYRNLNQTQNQLSSSLEKLSSGFRINRAADDASGLVNSENLRAQIGGLKVATRNAQDAISMVQTAEGAQTEVHSILQRMRDLTVQSGNLGTNDDAALQANQDEINELVSELDRIAEQTQFGTKAILEGQRATLNHVSSGGVATAGSITFGAGLNSASSLAVLVTAVNLAFADMTDPTAENGTDTFDSPAFESLDDLKNIIVSNSETGESTTLYDLYTNDDTGEFVAGATTGGFEVGTDPGEYDQISAVVKGETSFTFQVGANANQTVEVAVGAINSSSLGVNELDVASGDADTIAKAIESIDKAIGDVSSNRATLGAFQNRMESTIRNVSVAVENLSAAESRIRDTDMALEMVEFTRNQILSQAGTAMLAQANMVPQSVLSLLG